MDDSPHVALRNSTQELEHELFNLNRVKHFLLVKCFQEASEILVDILEDQIELGVFIDDVFEPT